jgi:hypothetical protein
LIQGPRSLIAADGTSAGTAKQKPARCSWLAVKSIGQQAGEKFHWLAFYCHISDTVHMPKGAIARILPPRVACAVR